MSDIGRFQKLSVKRGLTPGALIDASPQDFDLLLLCVRRSLTAAVNYSERQVNDALKAWLGGPGGMLAVDHVELRRWLVDLQILTRDAYGKSYSLAAMPARLQPLEAVFAGADFAAEFVKANEQELQRRAERKAAWKESQAGAQAV